MNVFAVVKENVTARQVAMQYGIKINRSGLACCPFHKDKTPSMKIDKRYYCFGCGDTGDAIDFVAKYFGLAPKEAAMKIARVLDDSELVAFVHYVLVHPEYQGQKIAGNMVEYIRDKYKNYLYIEGMPEDSKNVAFYERHGFHVMEGGTPIQICNFLDKR